MNQRLFNYLTISLLLIFSTFVNAQEVAQDSNQSIIPDTLPWSQRMAETVLREYPVIYQIENRTKKKWSYTFGLIGLSFQKLWEATGDERYYEYGKKYIDDLVDENGIIYKYRLWEYNLDRINSGKMLFLLYERTGEERYKISMDTLRKQLKTHPRTSEGGFWHKKVYAHQMWLDGLYMGAPYYAQYSKAFNEPENFDDVVLQLVLVEEKTRHEETGLLHHAWDESKQQRWADSITGKSPHVWGRGMGWYAMALVDVLDFLPKDHPQRDTVLELVNKVAMAIIKVQDKETGCWRQVLDQGERKGNYLEGSVSSMFTYFLLKSIKYEYIDSVKYMPYAIKAFNGFTEHLVKVEKQGQVIITPVCAVAGLGGNPYRDGSYDYYINEVKRDNDPKAVGPFILASLLYEEMTGK